MILKLKSTTTRNVINGELGRHTLEIDNKQRVISFWMKLYEKESI